MLPSDVAGLVPRKAAPGDLKRFAHSFPVGVSATDGRVQGFQQAERPKRTQIGRFLTARSCPQLAEITASRRVCPEPDKLILLKWADTGCPVNLPQCTRSAGLLQSLLQFALILAQNPSGNQN